MSERKDRLIQTRVPEKLETTLKEEAQRRRTTVSQMIRNILEDTFDLVDGVVANVDQIVTDSARLAQRVGRDARRIGETAREAFATCQDPLPEAEERLGHVQAWNEVVLNKPAPCSRCGAELTAGLTAYLGLSDDASRPPAWVCSRWVDELEADEADPE